MAVRRLIALFILCFLHKRIPAEVQLLATGDPRLFITEFVPTFEKFGRHCPKMCFPPTSEFRAVVMLL
jgi:hypothetical protein